MAPLFARTVSKIYKRIVAEIIVEIPLLLEKWRFILFGIFWQYLHGVAARIAHYLHRPGPILHDIGFDLLPELGPEKAWISEMVFTFIFAAFVLWTFHPFVFQNKRFYTVYLWYRVLVMLVIAQGLRVVSFLVTQLPGPNYHCREGSAAATLPPPEHISDVLLLNFPHGVIYGCGDLIFSSHMTFCLTFVHAYARYGTNKWIKRAAWLLVVIQSLLIVASRKHYTVDVVIAWYVVILLFNYVGRKFYDPETFLELFHFRTWERSSYNIAWAARTAGTLLAPAHTASVLKAMDRAAPGDELLPRRNGRKDDFVKSIMTNGHTGTDHWDVGRQRNGKIPDVEAALAASNTTYG